MSWVECVCDSDYEIFNEYPYQIKRKGTNKIIKETIDIDGYVRCSLNLVKYRKHRIIALQFIPNPENLPCIDHMDHNRANNHIENLRWCSYTENNRNKSSNLNVVYEYVDSIDDNAIEITDYGKHHFEFYYYVEADDSFYYYTGQQYRKLHVGIDKKYGSAFVEMRNSEDKRTRLYLNKFKRLYGIEF